MILYTEPERSRSRLSLERSERGAGTRYTRSARWSNQKGSEVFALSRRGLIITGGILMQPESQMTPEQVIDSLAEQAPRVSFTSTERDGLLARAKSGIFTREQLLRAAEQLKIQKLGDTLQSIAQVNFAGFILEQPYTSANVGGKAEFHGYLVNLSDTDLQVGGCGAGIIVPSGLHGSAFPFTYNLELPQTLPRLSVFGPALLFSVEIPYGSVRPSDQVLVGSCGPTFKDAADTTEGHFRGDKPAFFYITLAR